MVVDRSDIKAVLVVIFEDLFSSENYEPALKPYEDIVDIFLDAALFSKHDEGCTESSMSFEDFRSWCSLLPSVRKFLGNLLIPPDPGSYTHSLLFPTIPISYISIKLDS